MIDDIGQHLAANPFQPFTIVKSGAMKYRVAGRDHAGINPCGTRLVVRFDDGGSVTIACMHINTLEEEATASQAA